MQDHGTFCCLCGDNLKTYPKLRGEIFGECPEWRKSVRKNGYVSGKPDDLNCSILKYRGCGTVSTVPVSGNL
jgi:hypothetical protein